MSELLKLSARELSGFLKSRKVSARELTEAALARIESLEPKILAFLTVSSDKALAQADDIDVRRVKGDTLSPLAGIPYAVKDNFCTNGIKTTAGSKILHNFIPPYDATVISKLRATDAILIGKTNLDEFAMGSSTENSGFQVTRNPWDISRVPGGSSGGSAASVSSCEVSFSLGSDTGGSVRQPASFCGVVGLKPTYGRVSRYGLIAYASSLDQISPFGKEVYDCALVMNAVAGHDPLDSTSANLPVPDYTAACQPDIKGLKIGVPKEYFGLGVQPEIASSVRIAIDKLAEMGAIVEECSLPSTEYALAAYYIIAPAECSSNLARFDGVKYGLRTKEIAGHIGLTEKTRDEGFGSEVKQRIMIGTYTLSAGYYDAYYKRAQQVRTLIRQEFERAFQVYDLLLTPTSPTTAFKVGEKSDPLQMKLADVCTIPINLAGLPAMSIPCGFSNGLPVGMQFIAKAFDEAMLFRAATAYESITDWRFQQPNL